MVTNPDTPPAVSVVTGDAKSKRKDAPREPDRQTVAEWTVALKFRRSIVAGAAHRMGWTRETPVTEAELRRAVAAFEKKPLGGGNK